TITRKQPRQYFVGNSVEGRGKSAATMREHFDSRPLPREDKGWGHSQIPKGWPKTSRSLHDWLMRSAEKNRDPHSTWSSRLCGSGIRPSTSLRASSANSRAAHAGPPKFDSDGD